MKTADDSSETAPEEEAPPDWSSRWGRLPLDHDYVVAIDYTSRGGDRWQMVFAVTEDPRVLETRLWHGAGAEPTLEAVDYAPPEGLHDFLLTLDDLQVPVIPDGELFLDGAFYDVTVKNGVSSHRFILTGPGKCADGDEDNPLREWLQRLVKIMSLESVHRGSRSRHRE